MNKDRKTHNYFKAYLKLFDYYLKKGLRRKANQLQDVAVKSEVLSEKGRIRAILPFFWKKHLKRIHGSVTQNANEFINDHLCRTHFEFDPVVVFWLKDVVLLGGSIYSNCYRRELRALHLQNRIGLKIKEPIRHISSASLASTVSGSTWWGHWLFDELPLQMLASNFSPPISFDRPLYRDENTYQDAFCLNKPNRINCAFLDELIIVDEHAQNPIKTKRYHDLRNRLLNIPVGHKKIFLKRGTSGLKRVLINQNEIAQDLEKEGFITIDISKCDGKQLIEKCRGAEIVVSVEGSHIAPLLYMIKKYGLLVILNPPYRVETSMANRGVFCGISSSMFICEAVGDSIDEFIANRTELLQFIDESYEYADNNKEKIDSFLDEIMSI